MYIRWKLGVVFKQLDLQGIYIPIFQRIQRTPNKGYSIILKFRLGMSPTKFLKKQETIAVGLKARSIDLERISANRFRLKVRKGEMLSMPSQSSLLPNLEIPTQTDQISLGVDIDGYEINLPLFTQDGGTNTLIGGNPGKGKTSALKLIVSGLASSKTAIFWFDPKNGSDANPYRSRVNVVASPLDPQPYIDCLINLNKSVANRNAILARGGNIDLLPKIIVMVDEWAMLGTLGTKSQQHEFTNQLRRLVSTGRSSNISVVLSTQRPTSITIDVATRELSVNRIAFFVGDEYASEAILGIKGAENQVDPLQKGQVLAWINGDLSRISLYKVPEDLQTTCLNTSGFNSSIDELLDAEYICSQELGISF